MVKPPGNRPKSPEIRQQIFDSRRKDTDFRSNRCSVSKANKPIKEEDLARPERGRPEKGNEPTKVHAEPVGGSIIFLTDPPQSPELLVEEDNTNRESRERNRSITTRRTGMEIRGWRLFSEPHSQNRLDQRRTGKSLPNE